MVCWAWGEVRRLIVQAQKVVQVDEVGLDV